MASRLTLLVLTSKTGVPRKLSVNKYLLCCFLLLLAGLCASGVIGARKHRENILLKKEYQVLVAKKRQMESVGRSVAEIRREQRNIRELLGLDNDHKPRMAARPGQESADQGSGP